MWSYFFSWYHGQIWPNILASILTGLFVFISTHYLLRSLERHHREQMDKQQLQHLELLDRINNQDNQ